MHTNTYIQTHTHKHIQACNLVIHTHTHAHTHAHTHTYIQAGALRALLDTATSAERHNAMGRAAPSGADGGSPVKIALFSLGNMCAHRECREALLALNIWDAIRR